jgi:hypothetical protein
MWMRTRIRIGEEKLCTKVFQTCENLEYVLNVALRWKLACGSHFLSCFPNFYIWSDEEEIMSPTFSSPYRFPRNLLSCCWSLLRHNHWITVYHCSLVWCVMRVEVSLSEIVVRQNHTWTPRSRWFFWKKSHRQVDDWTDRPGKLNDKRNKLIIYIIIALRVQYTKLIIS